MNASRTTFRIYTYKEVVNTLFMKLYTDPTGYFNRSSKCIPITNWYFDDNLITLDNNQFYLSDFKAVHPAEAPSASAKHKSNIWLWINKSNWGGFYSQVVVFHPAKCDTFKKLNDKFAFYAVNDQIEAQQSDLQKKKY
jgi:hypothetical protein